ncbi:MAG: hypothetical protein J5887_04315 [Erysipelotrichaceae bacterium]|nr:hypothetical protein [Erysipelotrichaceae bacterium]
MPNWFKLDNAAQIYPPVLNSQWAAMFRLSADLTEDVDPEILKQAQERVLKRMPSFATTLRYGLFWFYLEHIDGQPPISEDINNPLQRINFRKNNRFMYRLLYYRNRIAVEFFHSLTDGTGGMTFLMTLISEYLHIRYGDRVQPGKYILSCDEEPVAEEYEDAFRRYFREKTIGISEKKSYQYWHTRTDFNKTMIISGSVDSEKLREIAHGFDVPVGTFCAALLLYSALQLQKMDHRSRQRKRMVKISVPVNLRRFFPSRTLRNFSAFVNPGLYGSLGDYSLKEVVDFTKNYLGIYVTEKQQLAKFSFNVAAERHPLLRITPLFLKIPALFIAYFTAGDLLYCSTISNLGNITLPEETGSRIKRLDFMLGRAFLGRSMLGCISYNGRCIFNFTRNIRQTELERVFFSTLVELGAEVFIESNGRD